ncbi:hypothetical protein KPSA3_01343 [Pseudomonas syringae pv. actinidiae]|uniref:Uncharacterized protein n=2 Tax=Pseudomonas syringae TaxID=317 RepID=A0AAN4Q1D8_PSESF|nr:hypothetical protein KPSA3_01343 [Pseudomonas syringae pv. actinidiae]
MGSRSMVLKVIFYHTPHCPVIFALLLLASVLFLNKPATG